MSETKTDECVDMVEHPKIGTLVKIRYIGGVKGQQPRDVHDEGEPLAVTLGTLSLPRGIEKAIMTMTRGEKKTFEIPPEEGFGLHQDRFVEWYPRTMISNGYDLKKGDIFIWNNPETKEQQPAVIIEAKEDVLRLDFNHPYAGKKLLYTIELVDFK